MCKFATLAFPPVVLDNVHTKKDESLPQPNVTVTEIADEENFNDIDIINLNLDANAAYIKSSPYDVQANYLNLQELSLPYRLFSLALTQMQSTRPDYAIAPYLDSFNWPAVFSVLRQLCVREGYAWQRQEFYLVIFRSQLQATADRDRLGLLDQKSHEEACASGGLLTYWFGSPDTENRNLATCIWRNRADAAAGGKGPWHRKARGSAREMYERISFHTHRFVVDDGARSWSIEDYID